MKKDFDKDSKELYDTLSKLTLLKHKGSNLCCSCGNKGNFGAITVFECKSGRKYKLCGWCEMINKYMEESR